MGHLTHAGAAPRGPEVEQDVLVRGVLDDGLQRDALAVGVGLLEVDVGLADVGLGLLLGALLELGEDPGLLQFGREASAPFTALFC